MTAFASRTAPFHAAARAGTRRTYEDRYGRRVEKGLPRQSGRRRRLERKQTHGRKRPRRFCRRNDPRPAARIDGLTRRPDGSLFRGRCREWNERGHRHRGHLHRAGTCVRRRLSGAGFDGDRRRGLCRRGHFRGRRWLGGRRRRRLDADRRSRLRRLLRYRRCRLAARRRCNHRSARRFRRLRRLCARRRRQQCQRIDITLGLARHAHAEVDVRLRAVRGADRADERCALRNRRASRHGDRAEMQQRRRVSERRLDRDGLPAGWHGAGKGHDAVDRCPHRCALVAADVDATVLSTGVWMRGIEQERPQHRPVGRPRPRLRGCGR